MTTDPLDAERALRRPLDRARAAGRALSVLVVDLRDVGRIERACGQAAAARLLQELSLRVDALAPPPGRTLRVGRDRIVLATDEPADDEDALALARSLAQALREPHDAAGNVTVRVAATVGVARDGARESSAAELLRAADAAAHRARDGRGPAWRLADPGADAQLLQRLRIAGELSAALARGQLALYLQPIVSLRQGRLLGVEALVRWQHPARGLLTPAQFLPVAEESGLIVDVGAWVLDAVCEEVERRHATGPQRPFPRVSLNVSAGELRDARFAGRLADALATRRLPAQSLALEIAEPQALCEREDAPELLATLRELGVAVVLDRFGGAPSALVQLARLPLDGLKLDRALLAPATPGEGSVASAAVGLAHRLGLPVTIPGVETRQQLAAVRALGIDAAQGHLLGRPALASALGDLRRVERAAAAAAAARAQEEPAEWLSLSTVASALGVSPSTVRRLADQGVLPGTRTEGGHRRFRRADVRRLARERAPRLRAWELPARPLPAAASLIAHDGDALAERAARASYDPRRPGWFAAPHGLSRTRAWQAALVRALSAGDGGEAVAVTAAHADAAMLGGATAPEVVRYLGQFSAVATHELLRGGSGGEEARALQRIVSAALEAHLERLG